uniref:Persuasin 1 n=1 Tax=Lissotriton helveticus TaxID=256425 RepID=A0A346RP57_9SALA|nr:persuasin 1 [Lissotriton helveticus]AXS67859.1 persuasin 1 [Lissotriton helveticus]
MGVFATMVVLILCSVNAHSSHRKDGLRRRAVDSCNCVYKNGGCVISAAPPPNKACTCILSKKTCVGKIRNCVQPNAFFCTYPDTSLGTCLQGAGNCEGYSERCDCEYIYHWFVSDSCKITVPAIPRTACECGKTGWFTCGGKIVLCKNQYSIFCDKPGTTVESCLQGGWNCRYE